MVSVTSDKQFNAHRRSSANDQREFVDIDAVASQSSCRDHLVDVKCYAARAYRMSVAGDSRRQKKLAPECNH